MYQLLSKIGKLLFHRMGVMFTLIAAQIVLYVLACCGFRTHNIMAFTGGSP